MTVHVAITRRVRAGREREFEAALREFFQSTLASEGVVGVHMLVPPPGAKEREYGILRSFRNEAERAAFYGSPVFRAWQARVAPLVEKESLPIRELSGLEAWFRGMPQPPRWRMALATLAGVYPTSVALALTVGAATGAWPLLLRSLVFSVAMVAALTWLVMPLVTRALRPWLHPGATGDPA